MTPAELEDAKAAFLSRGGAVQVAPAGIAYGVSSEADKLKRADAREARRFELIERAAETRFQAGVEANGYFKS